MTQTTGSRETVRAVDVDGSEIEWDLEADVVVVGSGAAGHAAATTARAEGASVIMFEKAAWLGGTTGKSAGGVFWVPNNHLMRNDGLEDPRDDALRYMCKVAYPALYRSEDARFGLDKDAYDLIATFYDRGAEAIQRLVDLDVIHPVRFPSPDYYADFPEDKAPLGRSLVTAGAIIGDGGQMLIDDMSAAAERMGVTTYTDHRVIGLVRDSEGAEVIGVQVRAKRDLILVRAHQGVIFASGGFVQDPELSQTYLRGPIVGSCSVETSTGDFLRIGLDAGTDLGTMSTAWWSELILEQALASRSTSEAVTFNFGDSMFYVNRFGKRVMNEKTSYADRGQTYHYWSSATLEYPNRVLFMIYDDDVVQNDATGYARSPIPPKDENPTYVLSGDTWDELADRIQERLTLLAPKIGDIQLADDFVASLKETVERFNEFAKEGYDADFERGAKPVDLTFNQPNRDSGYPNPTMHPFRSEGPYHAILLGPGALDSKGGPKTDVEAQVLDTAGEPIPGLFGAGNCVASAAGEGYWGAGGTIGPALAFGYIAALAATRRPRRGA
ncbi:FAD-dependent oxidoreductase [Rhodococcus sp. 14C212]|uniref:FAD-dependent oxidoreductase n=1 Tax=Rhodococcus sp. 14C212 TaxID=2711209 RepID=UPI0013EA1C82|nr:FAD-dependent oxidoreductase [Rhodococcus sp. 14C212]NGP07393.1 FAD-dependent oxidoreductase [Rhodococcus sp. 14C212]